MSRHDAIVAVYAQHDDAEAAVREVAESGLDMKHFSIVGKGYHTDEKVIGFYNAGDQVKFWVKAEEFLVMAHGPAAEMERAKTLLQSSGTRQFDVYADAKNPGSIAA
jgi:hypothetical protein